ncbi:PASTA domain-containing protein [Microbacterium bovistercoris]|uniref:PASTA domain-containing protein n=1 Tax=Microbacterium bovistercoris TaxID=2293570 RepID=A0A371NVL1_9MICO|nr:transglycosylase domain-containing protein [Microbacterium bovistercoris]REJ05914.1 PASTA domain-containing protein [Microbacterium bovistercoris]
MPQTKRTVKGVLGGLLGLVGLSAVAGLLVTATVTPAIAMAGYTGSQALTLFDELPSYLKPSEPMAPTTIYANDTNGKPFKLATFYEQNRTPITFSQLSPTLVDAVLSSEDKNFYSHGGVNLLQTVKAAVENVTDTSSRGASTITQQYVKNVLIQQCEQDVPPEDDHYEDKMQQCFMDAAQAKGSAGIQRKLQEMRYALQVEKDYSKNDILLGYLNVSNFGGTTYGIEAAAQRYFSTSASKVTLVQAATLAGMVQEPNLLRIDRPGGTWTKTVDGQEVGQNSEADGYATTKDRRDYVLGQMYRNGQITKAQYDEAKATPVTPQLSNTSQGCSTAGDNAYFCKYVQSVLKSDPAFGATKEEREANLKRGGMSVYTTLDMRLQGPAIKAVHDRVPATMAGIALGGAGVSVEATTGRVLAMAQNTSFSESADASLAKGQSSQVFAADSKHGGGIGFQVGSTYKLFTLIDWLEKGHSVNEVLDGTTGAVFGTYKRDGCGGNYTLPRQSDRAIGNSGGNRGYTGSVMRFTAASLNSGFLAMAKQLNLCDINEVAKRMGVHLGSMHDVTVQDNKYNPGANDPFPSVLGSKNIAPLQIAGAYATVANKGKYCEPRVIDKVIGQDGKEIAPPKQSCTQVISPEVAATAAHALRGVMDGGTGGRANPRNGVQLIGKTGTAEKAHTMLVESSTRVATAVWVGNVTGDERLSRKSYKGIQLNNIRYPMAKAIQGAANDIYGGDAFPSPDKNLTRKVVKDLPNVVGMTVDAATKTLEDAGFQVSVGPAVDSNQPAGIVAAQAPGAGQVAAGTTVTISPSTGKQAVTGIPVPDVTGKSAAEAIIQLNGAGFSNIDWGGRCQPSSQVSETDPPAGTIAQADQRIKLECENGNGR